MTRQLPSSPPTHTARYSPTTATLSPGGRKAVALASGSRGGLLLPRRQREQFRAPPLPAAPGRVSDQSLVAAAAPAGNRSPLDSGVGDAGRGHEGGGPRGPPDAGVQGARAKGAPQPDPQQPGWAGRLDGPAAMSPAQRRRQLLFGDPREDGAAAASEDAGCREPDPRAWPPPPGPPAQRQDLLLGVLKAAEARGRLRALRLRYTRMRAEEISLLIRLQASARAAVRLELFLPPQLKPTRIPDPLERQERRRVEAILEEKVEDSIFRR
ncbi:protein LKAAEAR1 [Talpa occidentalis]|uniref:protein LKAAEAR1 n=1 Tax=Talpa occidentalis TaxID=50954 RepID=UPI00188FBF7D|nr:protein LKAAEAR1 [Talpa occidentalis]